ncbi:hypothetical protein RJ639_007974, partial [Escallonia herrerae]
MRALLAKFRSDYRTKASSLLSIITSRRAFSQIHSSSPQPSFGIAFDIDGVVLRGDAPIGGSPQALRRLYNDSGTLKIPYVFLTNDGGVRESKRAFELSKVLGVNILPSQVIQGHSPFKHLVNRFENELIVAVGKGEPAAVMTEYGFKNVLSIDEYASNFDNIDPLAQYKNWKTGKLVDQHSTLRKNAYLERVQAVFIVSDSVDWSRDIQVLCDILRTGGLPGREISYQPPLYFAHDDLAYQVGFISIRTSWHGCFRIGLESIFNGIHPRALEYTTFGKPNPLVFRNAEIALMELVTSDRDLQLAHTANGGNAIFRALYMIGDNPSVDIKGAQQIRLLRNPWFSILTRTGVFKGNENHAKHPADL